MFRALAAAQREGYQDHSQFVQSQTRTFTQQLPNQYPSVNQPAPNVLADAKYGLATWDPNTRQTNVNNIDIQSYTTGLEISQQLKDQQAMCTTASIDGLINTQATGQSVRCGWIYKKGTPGDKPQVSVGALGTRDGPLASFQNPAGTWYWNLDDAKKAIMGDRCAALTSCGNVGSQNYAGCAYSTTRGVGVPVDGNGQILYPKDIALSAPASSLIRSASACPPPPPPGSPQAELLRSRDVCAPMANGRLSRDCMLQQITAAGCKTDGTLYNALINQATPNNYAAGLTGQTSFNIYQQRSSNPLLENAIREGQVTTAIALENFGKLSQEASQVRNTAINFAARDLCTRKGVMADFDFCSELTSTTRGPYGLECLQKEFLRGGGQPAGTMYPTAATKSTWDILATWGAVQAQIQNLAQETRSTNSKTQREGLLKFLGIQREPTRFQQIGRIPGVEVFWFDRANNTFIGRRSRITNPALPDLQTWGEVDGTGLSDNAEYYVLTNVRPPTDTSIRMRLETDDGSIFTLNKHANGETTRGGFFDTADTFGANWDQAPTGYNQGKCWDLRGEGPNYLMGFWQETGGFSHSRIFYAPCNGGSFTTFPAEWLTLTQEPDAPVFSWQGVETPENTHMFIERRFPTVMELIMSPQTSVTRARGIPDINAVLNMRVGGNGYAVTRRALALNSWRTMTTQFYINSLTNGMILELGPLTVSVQNGQVRVRWNSATLSVVKEFPATVGAYYLVVNMRSDYNGTFPNRLTIAFGLATQFVSGSINIQQIGSQVVTYTTTNNSPLYNKQDSAKLYLGDKNTGNTADVSFAYVRVFDYELINVNLIRDIQNAWLMKFI
jgi:hypothetical protein